MIPRTAATGWLGSALAGLVLSTAGWADGWPMEGHDVRRTGQSRALGPPSPAGSAVLALDDEQAVNVPLTVGDLGTVYLGTWGITRSYGLADRTLWHKLDGKVFALSPELSPAWPEPFPGDLVPYCYSYPGRPASPPAFCPEGGTLNGYTGTVEGTGALAPDGGTLYVGRGDGKLYALDSWTGALRWRFATFNPEDPADPEGGGEVIAAPLVAPDGTVYLATVAAGPYETNAVYALAPDGRLLWRFPHGQRSWSNIFVASPALSPDGRTLYVAGAWGPVIGAGRDNDVPGSILAFDLAAPSGTGDERLRWVHHPINEGEWWRPTVWTTALAVGADGTLYASGPEYTLGGGSAVAFAVRDAGDHAEPAWPRMVDLDRDRANFTLGIALREVAGVTTRVYASSGTPLTVLHTYGPGGKLYALDPATGSPLWPAPFDPEAHGGFGALTGIAIDAAGVVYTGVSGQADSGKVFAIGEDGQLLWDYELGGLLQWSHPVLGPEGNLYFADTRTCIGADVFPVDAGWCAGRNIDPAVYVVYGTGGGPCVPDETTLCLQDGRFRLEVEWRTPQGGTGRGRVVPLGTRDSGLLWFFRAANWEMLVKVLDGCAFNGHFWTFFAATTNVAFRLRVTDTEAGATRTYANPQGESAHAVTDTRSFATCTP